jgi:hypothetical protein
MKVSFLPNCALKVPFLLASEVLAPSLLLPNFFPYGVIRNSTVAMYEVVWVHDP